MDNERDILTTMTDPATNLFVEVNEAPSRFRAIRSQADNLQDIISFETGLDTRQEEPLTRQEFKDETDIDYILRRYTGGGGRRPMYEDDQYNVDLQTALHAKIALEANEIKAPPELQTKYPTTVSIMQGIENGQYQKDLEHLRDTKAAQKEAETLASFRQPEAPPQTPKTET